MAGFSIDAALKSGFRLARREWKATLVWGFIGTALVIATQLISVGSALPRYLEEVGRDPQAAAATMEQASAAQAIVTVPIIMFLALAIASLLYGAMLRAVLRPGEGGWFFIRVGRSELWLMLTWLALGAIVVLALFLAIVALGAAIGVLVMVTGVLAGLWWLLLAPAALAGYLYLSARFSLAWIVAWDEGRFSLMDSWNLTRGHGWRIVLMMLALVFLVLIVSVVVMIPATIISGIIFGVAGMVGGPVAITVAAVLMIVVLALFSAFYGMLYAVMTAPYIEIYRSLKGVSRSETAEVFA